MHRGSIFTFYDSLLTVKSNSESTIFGKITLMALEKHSLEIEENLFTCVLAQRDEQQQQQLMPETEKI